MYPDDVKADGWERPILCDTKVFQYGDALAIVCADTLEQAQAAVPKVKVELEELPAYMSALDAIADDAIEIYPGTPNSFFTQQLIKGEDTEEIFESAAHVVEGKYYLQRQPHLYFEPDCGFAYTDEEGRLTIHSKSIALNFHAAMINEGLGVELENLRMVQNNTGGTFGYKFCPTMEALLGAAHMATGRMVYLKYDYWMSIAYTGKRSPHWYHCKLAADENGKFLGHGEPLALRPRAVHGVRRQPGAEGPVLRRRLRHPQHARRRPAGAHQPLVGRPVPRLGLAAGVLRRRERRRRARPQDGHGPVRAALQEPRRARRHLLVGPGVRGLLVQEALRHGQALLRQGQEAHGRELHGRGQEGRRHLARHLRRRRRRRRRRQRRRRAASRRRRAHLQHLGGSRPGLRRAARSAPRTRRCARSVSRWSRSAST